MNRTGWVHSIQTMGTLDGPGVRFVVFTQGCNLRCGCCHNPDTWDRRGGTQYDAVELAERAMRYREYFGEQGGVTVSGGQKQRISIARALLKDAPILILDDSVSAVDTKTEQKILQNLEVERKGKTTIIIAHRITTVEGLDKIVYVDDGRVSAVGTHAELCETCAEYRRMVELQRLEEEGGEANV